MILAFALHLRASVAWTLFALPLLWCLIRLAMMWKGRGLLWGLSQWRSPRSLLVLATVFATVSGAHMAIDRSLHPYYAAEGDLVHHMFWDGVVLSLSDNPAWTHKYGALTDHATGDDLPVAIVRLAIEKLPADQRLQYLNSDGHPSQVASERILRNTFIDILSNDPGFVFQTFFSIKPEILIWSENILYRALLAMLDGWRLFVPVMALGVLAWLAARDANSFELLCAVAGAAFLCSVVACLPNWMVTVNKFVMIDNFTWGLLFVCFMPIILAARFHRLVRSEPGGRRSALLALSVEYRSKAHEVSERRPSVSVDRGGHMRYQEPLE
jgi:hypothetical protein